MNPSQKIRKSGELALTWLRNVMRIKRTYRRKMYIYQRKVSVDTATIISEESSYISHFIEGKRINMKGRGGTRRGRKISYVMSQVGDSGQLPSHTLRWTDEGIKFVSRSAGGGDHTPIGRRWAGSRSADCWPAVGVRLPTVLVCL